MPEFYGTHLLNWNIFLTSDSSVALTILSQCIWFNKHNINSCHDISFIGNLSDINRQYKSWDSVYMNTI